MRIAGLCLLLVVCAKGGANLPADGSPATDGSNVSSTSPAGQLAFDVSPSGSVTCETIELSIASAITDDCAIHLGWRDECDGCLTPPTKFGSIGKQCVNGAGAR